MSCECRVPFVNTKQLSHGETQSKHNERDAIMNLNTQSITLYQHLNSHQTFLMMLKSLFLQLKYLLSHTVL